MMLFVVPAAIFAIVTTAGSNTDTRRVTIVWIAVTAALRPLDRLSRSLAARAPHDLTPIETPAPAELRPVLDALNGFLVRLSRAMAAMQNFAGNANHQIRTPLTVARTQVAMAGKARGEARQTLDKADRALIRIERVLEQILLLARIEATGTRPVLTALDVAQLARGVTADFLPQAVALGKDLGFAGADSAMAWSEEVLLGELLRNLIDNALTHCPSETMVTVHVAPSGADGVTVEVIDTGPPIADADLAQKLDDPRAALLDLQPLFCDVRGGADGDEQLGELRRHGAQVRGHAVEHVARRVDDHAVHRVGPGQRREWGCPEGGWRDDPLGLLIFLWAA